MKNFKDIIDPYLVVKTSLDVAYKNSLLLLSLGGIIFDHISNNSSM